MMFRERLESGSRQDKKAHTGPKYKEPMDHMSGSDRKGSVIRVVPKDHRPKVMRGPPLPFGSSDPEQELLVLRLMACVGCALISTQWLRKNGATHQK